MLSFIVALKDRRWDRKPGLARIPMRPSYRSSRWRWTHGSSRHGNSASVHKIEPLFCIRDFNLPAC